MSEVAESLKTLSISRKSSKDMLSSLSSEVENTRQIRCWKGFACQHRNGSGQGWAVPGCLPYSRDWPQAGANPADEWVPHSATGLLCTAQPCRSCASPGQQPHAAGISGLLHGGVGMRKLFVGTADVR